MLGNVTFVGRYTKFTTLKNRRNTGIPLDFLTWVKNRQYFSRGIRDICPVCQEVINHTIKKEREKTRYFKSMGGKKDGEVER